MKYKFVRMPNGGPVIENADVESSDNGWSISQDDGDALSITILLSCQVRPVEYDGKLYFFWNDTDGDLEFRIENMGLQLSVKDDDQEKARKMRFIIDRYLSGDQIMYKIPGSDDRIVLNDIPVNFEIRVFIT